MNYKGLDYKTEWVDFPDVEPVLKKLGVPSAGKRIDGSDFYSVPLIFDPKTGKYVVESFAIALYLDETYPDTPRLFPPGTTAAVALYDQQFQESYLQPLLPLSVITTYYILTPRGQEFFRLTREKAYQKKLEEIAPLAEVETRKGLLEQVKEGLTKLASYHEKNGEDKLFYFGETVSYADFIIVSFLIWTKLTLPAEEWDAIANNDNGRWNKLLEVTKVYQRDGMS